MLAQREANSSGWTISAQAAILPPPLSESNQEGIYDLAKT